jgi:YVTN family beta-propeller protein
LDAATNTVVATVPVGPSPSGITVHPDGTRVFVVSGVGNGFFSVIDVATNAVTATTAVGERPNGVQVLPDGSRAYVANGNTNDVSVVDIVTNTVIATSPAGDAPHGVAVSPNGSRVYVTNENSSEITVIDPVTNTVIATIPIGPPSIIGLIGLSITPDGSLIYVAQLFADKVAVVDAATNTVLTHIPAGISPVAFGNFIAIPAACPVAPRTFTITVNPVPSLPAPNNVTVCGNQAVNVGFTPTAGAIVDWTNSNPAIGLAASGNGDLSFTAANVATTQTATITATPILGNCPGTPVNFTVTINPSATGSIAGDLLLCTGDTTTLTASGGGTYSSKYQPV